MNNSKINWSNLEFKDLINIKDNEIDILPNGVSISTMCASCKLGTIINIVNIEKYLELNTDDVLCVKMNKERIRSLIPEKKKNTRDKKNKIIKIVKDEKFNHFYNQITVIIRIGTGLIDNWETEPKINLKLFKNGSIQMSGCKSIKNINIVLNKLVYKLKMVKAKIEDGKIVEKNYVECCEKLKIDHFKIDMINSNYKVNMQIDRAKLFSLLLKKKIKSSFEPCIRACVIVKYIPEIDNDELKEISIFVFQKGNIIITGARRKSHIMAAYKYINNILINHSEEICKKDEKEEEDLILDLYNNILKDVESGLLTI
jgi:TATA-box binding protein (TBP) (component of TFIID and TFIIIB)